MLPMSSSRAATKSPSWKPDISYPRESGRTSGHLAAALDNRYATIVKKDGQQGARIAAESHAWAIRRVKKIVEILEIDRGFRYLPGYKVSKHPVADKSHAEDVKSIKKEVEVARELGLDVSWKKDGADSWLGWEG
ncbi:hypothetical protein BJX61DRAFT_544588 [Aspergillus egyptiacus]|nr:hypothetical protein BJX61DRAFT_544588 [Aspergillus egyptiacus]